MCLVYCVYVCYNILSCNNIVRHYYIGIFFLFRIQLYDILGAALTENSHKAAMETLVFTDPEHFDNVERYLWSASIKFNPKIEIIKSTKTSRRYVWSFDE